MYVNILSDGFRANGVQKAPSVTFNTRIYHPSITSDGSVCLGLLKSDTWKPSTRMQTVVEALLTLLADPSMDDAIEMSVAEVLRNQPAQFETTAREWTRRYATRRQDVLAVFRESGSI